MRKEQHEAIANAEYDLWRAGFGWVTNNGGVHLQVSHGGKTIADCWPTTQRLIMRTKHPATPQLKQILGLNQKHRA